MRRRFLVALVILLVGAVIGSLFVMLATNGYGTAGVDENLVAAGYLAASLGIVLLLSWLSAAAAGGLSARLHWRTWITLAAGAPARPDCRADPARHRGGRASRAGPVARLAITDGNHASRITHHVARAGARRFQWPTYPRLYSASPCPHPSSWPPARCPMMRPGCGRRIEPARVASSPRRCGWKRRSTRRHTWSCRARPTCARPCSTPRSGPISPGSTGSRWSCRRWQAIRAC